MADDSLSEDEINALLSGVDNTLDEGKTDQGPSTAAPPRAQATYSISAVEALAKSIAEEQTAQSQSFFGKQVAIEVAEIKSVALAQIKTLLKFPIVILKFPYTSPMPGELVGMMSSPEASEMLKEAHGKAFELPSVEATDQLQSTMQPFQAVADKAFQSQGISLDSQPLEALVVSDPSEIPLTESEYLLVQKSFAVQDGPKWHYMELYSPSLMAPLQGGETKKPDEDPFGGSTDLDSLLPGDETEVKNAEFMPLSGSDKDPEANGNISILLDVPMEVTVELGRSTKSIKEILSLGEGSIIELDKLAGEPVDLLVNHKPIAKGEVVVIDENFGVRVTEIISPKGRLESVD